MGTLKIFLGITFLRIYARIFLEQVTIERDFADLNVRISVMSSNSIVGPLLTDLYQLRMAYVYWKVDIMQLQFTMVYILHTVAGWKC